ncbi:MAG: bifunctional acetate--CoA ligase family protein/GNAT family N-acetyltransferase [Bacteroidia bacterium]
MLAQLQKLFAPQSVAVIGASNEPGTLGNTLMRNLTLSGFGGTVYPVHATEKSISGIRSYAHIGEVPDFVDLALLCCPLASVADEVEACGRAGVGSMQILSEAAQHEGGLSPEDQARILAATRQYSMHILGPNCLGLINTRINLNASLNSHMALPGQVAFLSQSRSLCTTILDWARQQQVGFSHFVSTGAMLDLGLHDLIDYFGHDPYTNSILIYLESLQDARRFISAARAFARNKPIIVLKAGNNDPGDEHAYDSDAAFDALCKRAGVLRVDTISKMFHLAQALAVRKYPTGKRLAIVSNANGPAILAMDHLTQEGGTLAHLAGIAQQQATQTSGVNGHSPIDLMGDASPAQYRTYIAGCIADPTIDGVLVIYSPQNYSDALAIAEAVISLARTSTKPILASWMGEQEVRAARTRFDEAHLPHYRYPEQAVDVFLAMWRYTEGIVQLREIPASTPASFSPDKTGARSIVERNLQSGLMRLGAVDTRLLLEAYGIPVLHSYPAATEDDAASLAAKIGYPVVMKIRSPHIHDKTAAGGVRLNIASEAALRLAYQQMLESAATPCPDAEIEGVSLEPMVHCRHELMIGSRKHPVFGPLITFGMGGVAVDVFRDLRVGLPPLNMALAMRLIEETRIFKLLQGYRGIPGVDIGAIQFLLYKFAYLVMDFPEIQRIEINPFAVAEAGGVVLDAAVELDPKAVRARSGQAYSHLIISPYPEELVRTVRLRNGREYLLRPIRPEDSALKKDMFDYFSAEALYMRFFEYIPQLAQKMFKGFAEIDYDREIAIVAEVEEAGKRLIVGEARLMTEVLHNSGEFAIVVADRWHGQGLGSWLLDYIIEIARQKGLTSIHANVLKINARMVNILSKRGFRIIPDGYVMLHAEQQLAGSGSARAEQQANRTYPMRGEAIAFDRARRPATE